MIGKRTRYSLAQFLDKFEISYVVTLLSKYDVRVSISSATKLFDLTNILRDESDHKILSVIGEIIRTIGDLRSRVSPKYVFDQRMSDFELCLNLDGYKISNSSLTQIDPSIGDGEPLEDDLISALKSSGLANVDQIILRINESSEKFRSAPPNYNACLNDIRVALETLAAAIAKTKMTTTSPSYDPTKWGSVILFLRQVGLVSLEEEKGLAGVYGFVSPGSHRPIGISDAEMARLGRSLSLGMCWFLIKTYHSTK